MHQPWTWDDVWWLRGLMVVAVVPVCRKLHAIHHSHHHFWIMKTAKASTLRRLNKTRVLIKPSTLLASRYFERMESQRQSSRLALQYFDSDLRCLWGLFKDSVSGWKTRSAENPSNQCNLWSMLPFLTEIRFRLVLSGNFGATRTSPRAALC